MTEAGLRAQGSATRQSLVVAGVMSGTSADGVDVAICRISPDESQGEPPHIEVLGHRAFPYPPELRAAVLAAMDARETTTAELARLGWRLGEVYAACVAETTQTFGLALDLVACHGQTIYHQGSAADFLGSPLRCTWQIGEASLIAERLRVPVVSDFRPPDMAAGGQGAPLVPMLDYCMFRDPNKSRLLLNLGGIANVTALPAGCNVDRVLAFDTGPANMVIDACMLRLTGAAYDLNGKMGSRGTALHELVEELLRESYFSAPAPKSCGREQFGEAFVTRFIVRCQEFGASDEDVIATATALTARSVADAYRRICEPHLRKFARHSDETELYAAGGGARNIHLMRLLTGEIEKFGVTVATTEAAGLAVDAKEAVAFALLGWLTWHGLPGNVPSATGASRGVILGKVTYA